MISRALPVLLLLTCALRAQVPPEDAVVLLEVTGGPARASLIAVDLASGTSTPLSRFPFDDRTPQAVALDPINGDVVVAVADPTGPGATVQRLGFTGTVLSRSRTVAATTFPVADLAIGPDGDLTIAGTQWLRVPRNGGAARVIPTSGPVLAAEVLQLTAFGVSVEDTASGPMLAARDLATGTATMPPAPIPNLGNVRITGVHDLPTGAIRQVLTDDQGRVHLFEFLTTLTTLSLAPPLPAGGAAATHGEGLDVLVVGGAAHPFLIRVKTFGPTAGAWQTVAGPFPGGAIDLDVARPLLAEVLTFAATCGGGSATWSGTPNVGNQGFGLRLVGSTAGVPAVLVLGFDDQELSGIPLPVPLVGGCSLHASVEASRPAMLDASGSVMLPVPIPAVSSLVGARVYGQWGVLVGGLATSDAFVVRIGP